MRAEIRQFGALLRLLWRSWRRRSLKTGGEPRAGGSGFLVVALAWTVYASDLLWSTLSRCAALGADRLIATRWALFGVVLLAISVGLGELVPDTNRFRPTLRATFLDPLPISPTVRAVLSWFQNPPLLVLGVVSVLALSPEGRSHARGLVCLVALAVLLFLTACTVGLALARLIRAIAPIWSVWLSPLWLVALAGGTFLLFTAPSLGKLAKSIGHDPLLIVARGLENGSGLLYAYLLLGAGLALALAVAAMAERIGYDRELRSRAGAAAARTGDRRSFERRLLWREGLDRSVLLTAASFLLATALAVLAVKSMSSPELVIAGQIGSLAVGSMISLLAIAAAKTAIRRDAAARNFLEPLPLSLPSILTQRQSALQASLLPLVAGFGGVFVLALVRAHLELSVVVSLLWRAGALVLAAGLVCNAAVWTSYVEGAATATGLGTVANLSSFVLMIPVTAALAAPEPQSSAAGLLVVAGMSWAVRRSALRQAAWNDDPARTEGRADLWRSLLALGVFYAVQLTSGVVLKWTGLTQDAAIPIALVVSAAVIVALTFSSGAAKKIRWVRCHPLFAALALPAGALSAAISILFTRPLISVEATVPSVRLPAATIVTLSIIVPIAEEIFFRGWLQNALAQELGPQLRRFTVPLAACVFAAAHVGSPFVPQLAVGLVTAWLYSRSGALLPAVLAHVISNALVLLI
jgi:membrane protease YdiL (CAAX protease family)